MMIDAHYLTSEDLAKIHAGCVTFGRARGLSAEMCSDFGSYAQTAAGIVQAVEPIENYWILYRVAREIDGQGRPLFNRR